MKVILTRILCDYPGTRSQKLERKPKPHEANWEGLIDEQVVFESCQKHVPQMTNLHLSAELKQILIRRIQEESESIESAEKPKLKRTRKWETLPSRNPYTCWCGHVGTAGGVFYEHLETCPEAQPHRLRS